MYFAHFSITLSFLIESSFVKYAIFIILSCLNSFNAVFLCSDIPNFNLVQLINLSLSG